MRFAPHRLLPVLTLAPYLEPQASTYKHFDLEFGQMMLLFEIVPLVVLPPQVMAAQRRFNFADQQDAVVGFQTMGELLRRE